MKPYCTLGTYLLASALLVGCGGGGGSSGGVAGGNFGVNVKAFISVPKVTSTTNFSFNLTLTNDTPDDLTFGAVAGGPAGWTVTAQVTSQAQAASTVVKAAQ